MTGRALQPTAGTTTTTSSRPSDTYWQPRPRAHKPTSNPQKPQMPDHPMPPRSISPASTADQNAEHQQEEPDPDRAATPPPPPPPPPPPKDIYATLASTLAPMDAEQYYQSIQQDLPEDHATLQGWKQEKRNDNEWGTEEDLLWEDTWKGTTDAFLEAAAETYPRPPGDTRHGLDALLAFHSWEHRDTITLHPLDHNPHRWTPEDHTSAAITVQQSPENREEYHITWNDRAPHPPASPTLPDVSATISAELQEAKAPQQLDKEMPQAPSPPTTQEKPRTEPLTHPITTMELPPQHRTTPDRKVFRHVPREWAVHNGTLRWDEITPGLQAIRLHSITEPTTTWALPTGRHHLLLTVQGDATITPTEGDPVTAAPAHAVHIPPQASSAPMAVHPGPTPWQAIVITYPTHNDHTHTWQQRWGDIRGDLLQEHLGLTRSHHTLHPI